VTVLYRSELAEVHQGRAEDVLATLATESVALVVTDPPYGVE
jgi:DNA modification methylase